MDEGKVSLDCLVAHPQAVAALSAAGRVKATQALYHLADSLGFKLKLKRNQQLVAVVEDQPQQLALKAPEPVMLSAAAVGRILDKKPRWVKNNARKYGGQKVGREWRFNEALLRQIIASGL